MRACLAAASLLVLFTACGDSKSNVAESDRILTDLDSCRKEREKTKNQFETCSKTVTELRANPPSTEPEEIVVRVEGDTLTVVGKMRGQTHSGMPTPTELGPEEQKAIGPVRAQIAATKSQIQQCYTQALKADDSLANTPIELRVTIVVNPSGAITNPRFSPQVSAKFESCMKAVAAKWKIPPYKGKAFPLAYPINLQPIR